MGGWRALRLSWKDPNEATNGDADTQADTDSTVVRRVLTHEKSPRRGRAIELVFRNGGFSPDAVDPEAAELRQRGPGRDGACDAKFLDLLAKIGASGGYVH